MNQRRHSRPPRRSGLSQREASLLLPQLYDLWHLLVSEPEAPYLDRWLSRTLGALEKLSREKRLWLGARLIDGVRFAWLALLCHEAQGLGPHAAVAKVRAGVDDLDEAWRMLGGLDEVLDLLGLHPALGQVEGQFQRLAQGAAGMRGDEVVDDVLERNAISPRSSGKQAKLARKKLQVALDSYPKSGRGVSYDRVKGVRK